MDLSKTEISRLKRIGFDTSLFIYFIEKNQTYIDVLREIFSELDKGKFKGYGSVITLTEVLIYPLKLGKNDLVDKYLNILQHSRNFEIISIDPNIAIISAKLRSAYTLRTPDAMQIASMISVNCQAFITNDKRLKTVNEIKVITLDDLLLQMQNET